ncbi:uncharacterized protein LOC116132645 [Pistacia vera]|uniref:uncharacterized protein LOC116132645 n=1 Tax=Pistacia vera TaxID=55513 RepID=UPI0012633E41|nr:uncharacterized protein LOC116132645 [Pistacia vera]
MSVPNSVFEAITHDGWRMVMEEEMLAPEHNDTWVLMELPENKKAIGCKWVFTIKANPDGTVARLKARLVAKASSCCPLHQLDVKNVFLHGDLLEEVYMEQPPRFVAHWESGKVSRSKKEIFLSQRKYVLDMLTEMGLSEAKPCDTPMVLNVRLKAEDGEMFGDLERYRRIDISLGYDPPYFEASTRSPWAWILYSDHGHNKVEGFSDADWAGSSVDRRSDHNALFEPLSGLPLARAHDHAIRLEPGHIISAQGIAVDPSKVDCILNWPISKDVNAFRGFLGLIGYYRKFVNVYGKIALPLTNLLHKDAFHWTESSQKVFEELKRVMTTIPVLAMPNFSKTFIVETDMSGQGIGAMLMQDGKPLAFLSQGLSTRS